MKIAYVSTYLPKQCGIATYTDYLIQGIRKVSPNTEIKVIAEQGASWVKEKHLRVIPCWSREENYVDAIITQAKDVDVVHVQHEYSIYKFDDRLPTVLKKIDPRIKKVITIHCIRPAQFSERGSLDENFAAKIARLADEVVVHLESQKSILTRLGISFEKIHVIPHGTKIENQDKIASRKRLGLPLNSRIILMFGFVKRHKCLHISLEALAEVRERFKDVCLFIAGGLAPQASVEDKQYAEFISRKIEELNLSKNVIYPKKFFPNEDVPYLFGACDIILFPYYEEDRSASGSLHLALGQKKPVIASRIPKFEELKEICDELLILPYNSSGIANTIIRLFEDQKFKEYVENKIHEFRRKTSWEVTAEKHLRLYQL